jgi:hypothetical protein
MRFKDTLSQVWPSAPSFSRRQWLRKAAVAGGGLGLASALPQGALADDGDSEGGGCILQAQCDQPLPIPHLNTLPFGSFHFFFPGPADAPANPSVITDFRGVIGSADLNLTGTGTDTTSGLTGHYAFHTDMRFMKGEFVALDGKIHSGAFAFI